MTCPLDTPCPPDPCATCQVLSPEARLAFQTFRDHPDLNLSRRDVQRLTRLSTDQATRSMRELRSRGLIARPPRRPGTRPAHRLDAHHA
jgi:hypothetical protein